MKQKSQKKPVWRIVAFILGAAAIIIMWASKDVTGQFAGMSPEQALPIAMTSVVVTLMKAALLTGVVLLIKWIAGKIKK